MILGECVSWRGAERINGTTGGPREAPCESTKAALLEKIESLGKTRVAATYPHPPLLSYSLTPPDSSVSPYSVLEPLPRAFSLSSPVYVGMKMRCNHRCSVCANSSPGSRLAAGILACLRSCDPEPQRLEPMGRSAVPPRAVAVEAACHARVVEPASRVDRHRPVRVAYLVGGRGSGRGRG